MNNKTKTIVILLPLVLFTVKGVAQSAYGDLLHALNYSQAAANASSSESAAYYSSHAFHGSGYNTGHNYGHSSSHSSGHSYGSTVTPAQSGRRSATNMSNVGLKTNSSGYNRGAELAKYYAQQRAERARLKAQREQRMVNSYMQTHYDQSQRNEASWQMYIDNNSHAKPFREEEIYEFISNGLPGNVIIDDNGMMNMAPEALLEGTGGTLETFEERLKHMSDEEIDGLAEELIDRYENGEELSDDEWGFLYAREKEREARLEEEKRQLEEINRQLEERLNKQIETINNSIDLKF